jgi:hypothetical protein
MSSSILNFQKFKLLLEDAATTPAPAAPAAPAAANPAATGAVGGEITVTSEVSRNFNFAPGAYREDQIDKTALDSLKNDLINKTIKILANNALDNRKVIIELEASTSTTPVTPNLAKELGTEAGIKGNVKLCEARMNTLERIIASSLASALKVSEAEVKSKFEFKKVNKANQGPGVENQYIKANVIQSGTKVDPSRIMGCNFDQDFAGGQATAANNYVGYGQLTNQQLVTVIQHGQVFSFVYDSLSIPDCIYVKYGDDDDSEFLSPFTGVTTDSKRDFVKELNALNADPANGLVAKINAELKKVGSNKTVEMLQPNFFKKDAAGNLSINVLQGRSQGGPNQYYVKKFTRTAINNKFTVRVFSPLGDTQFKVKIECR